MPHAPASVGREAKGLLRQQGFKSLSYLIGLIIAYNSPLIYQSMKLKYIQCLLAQRAASSQTPAYASTQNSKKILQAYISSKDSEHKYNQK